jgi:transcriptional regulator with XRE-family HTH domain
MTTTEATPNLKLFPERLEWAIKRTGMKQTTLARAVGITPQAVSKMLSNQRDVYIGENGAEMARALGVPIEWLVYGQGGIPPPPPKQFTYAGLTHLQSALLDALHDVMAAGLYPDDEAIDTLAFLKPRVTKARAPKPQTPPQKEK